MKTKFFTLLSLSVLALVMMVSLVSAVSLDSISGEVIPTEVSQDDGSFTFTFDLTNTGTAGTLDFIDSVVDNEGATIIFDDSNIADGSTPITETITATVTFPFDSTSPISGTVDVIGEGASTHETLAFSVPMTPSIKPEDVQTCLLEGNNDDEDLQLSIEDVTVTGFGDGDEGEWFAFDEIEVEIEVENDNNDYKMKEIEVFWGLYNSETNEWYIEEEENDFRLSEGDKKTLLLSFSLDDDIDELIEYSGDYVFYVWANAVLDTETEVSLCASAYEKVEEIMDDEFVIINNIQMVETTACGTSVELTADVWNIGSEDQVDVYVIIESEDSLGLTQRVDIGEIDAYEDEEISVLLNIPQDAEEKIYSFFLTVFDEYGDAFENSNDDKARFQVDLKVEGNCINEPKVTISADLESEAKAGRELIIKTTIVNTGTETSTFDVSLSDYAEWASFGSISSESVTLDAGESEEVMVTLNVNSDISGNQNFEVIVTEGTKVLTQPVSVMIEKASGFAGITGGLISEGNWPIWTIGAINVVLVFVIILVALKVAKKQ